MKNFIYLFLFCAMLVSCFSNVSKADLSERVKSDISAEFSKKASEYGMTYTIHSLTLVHKSGNEYSGILKTTEDGQEFSYQVDVTVDGDSYMWQIVN